MKPSSALFPDGNEVAWAEYDPTPKEITKDKDTGAEVASFSYYDGIYVAKKKGLHHTVHFKDVFAETHYIVCCGDVMIKVNSSDYPEIKRREI